MGLFNRLIFNGAVFNVGEDAPVEVVPRLRGGAQSNYVDPRIEEARQDAIRAETRSDIQKAIESVRRPKKAKEAAAQAAPDIAINTAALFVAPVDTTPPQAAPLMATADINVDIPELLFAANDEIAIALLM